jgi:P4 family phage/plasmid primase-like protien
LNLEPLCEFEPPKEEMAGNWRLSKTDGGTWKGVFEPDAIVAQNCILRIMHNGVRTEPFTQDFFSFGTLGTDYKPNATCPVFGRFIKQVIPDDDTRRALQNAFGYSLGWHRDAQKIFFLMGYGRNGKSTLLNIFQAVLGQGNYSTVSWREMDGRFEPQQFTMKRVNISEETQVDKDDISRVVAQLKDISGGGVLYCDRKNLRPFEAKAVSQLIFGGNEIPHFPDETKGTRRRLVVIPMKVELTDAEAEPGLDKKIIQTELPGVLNWLLEGLSNTYKARLQGEGQFWTLFDSEEILAASGQAWELSNPFAQLVKDNFRRKDGSKVFETQAAAYINHLAEKHGLMKRSNAKIAKTIETVHGVERTRAGGNGERHFEYRGLECVEKEIDGEPINAADLTAQKQTATDNFTCEAMLDEVIRG